jgi:ParB family transcriptional regulator, chromosome partitioning protein
MSTPPPHDPKRRALGRGLESLLPSKPAPAPPPAAPVASKPDGKAFEIDVNLIDRNPFQTRTHFDEAKLAELAGSIAASGVIQPIAVRPLKEGRYTLITGERRVLASRKAGLKTIPAVIREVSDVQAMEMTIIENLQRADLNPMEQARAFHRLSSDFHMTQEQMAIRTGKERSSVTNFLRLLRLPETLQESVEQGNLTFGHARALLALENPDAILAAGKKVLALNLSVRATENFVQGILSPEPKIKQINAVSQVDPNVREAQDQLRRSLGLKVTIEDKKGRGKVIIEYSGVEDFDAILAALGDRPSL